MGKRNKQKKLGPSLDEVLHYINRFITVDKGKKQFGNPILRKILNKITESLKFVSPLFKALFETHLYAGSSYDGLKIGKADEFDIDLKLRLPKILNVEVLNSDKHGFVRLYIKNWETLEKNKSSYLVYKELEQFKDEDNFISQVKIKEWMQSIVTQAINRIGQNSSFGKLKVTYKMSGPAVTLVVGDKMTIDLVAVFAIPGKQWPANPVRQNIHEKPDFLVVPKAPKTKPGVALKYSSEKYWRLSFPEQERQYMFNKSFCKPSVRYLKKLRDTREHNIPSYFIKTIFLWEVQKRDESFWRNKISIVFVEMLKTYKRYLENHKIPYFWDASHNLLENISDINISNIKNYLEGVISDIENNPNALIVAKHILSPAEYEKTCRRFGVSEI